MSSTYSESFSLRKADTLLRYCPLHADFVPSALRVAETRIDNQLATGERASSAYTKCVVVRWGNIAILSTARLEYERPLLKRKAIAPATNTQTIMCEAAVLIYCCYYIFNISPPLK